MNGSSKNDCSAWPDQPQLCFILDNVVRSSLALSGLGSLLIILFMSATRKYRVFVQKLVLAIAVNSFLYSVALLSTSSYQMTELSTVCVVHAAFMQYFVLTLLLWIFVITCHLFMRVYNVSSFLLLYFFRAVCPAVLILPLIPTIYLLLGDYYGPAGLWCWIKNDNLALRFGLYYIPFFVSIGIEIVLYILIIIKAYKDTRPQPRDSALDNINNTRYREEVKPLLLFPIIYMVLLLPLAVIRVNEALDPGHKPSFALAIFSSVFANNSGFINSVVYLAYLTERKELSLTNLCGLLKTMCRQTHSVEHGVEVFSCTTTNTYVDQ